MEEHHQIPFRHSGPQVATKGKAEILLAFQNPDIRMIGFKEGEAGVRGGVIHDNNLIQGIGLGLKGEKTIPEQIRPVMVDDHRRHLGFSRQDLGKTPLGVAQSPFQTKTEGGIENSVSPGDGPKRVPISYQPAPRGWGWNFSEIGCLGFRRERGSFSYPFRSGPWDRGGFSLFDRGRALGNPPGPFFPLFLDIGLTGHFKGSEGLPGRLVDPEKGNTRPPLLRKDPRKAGSEAALSMARAQSVTFMGSIIQAASPTTSGMAPVFEQRMGNPQPIASSSGKPNPSLSEGKTNAVAPV